LLHFLALLAGSSVLSWRLQRKDPSLPTADFVRVMQKLVEVVGILVVKSVTR